MINQVASHAMLASYINQNRVNYKSSIIAFQIIT